MREFKFRAWDKTKKKMRYGIESSEDFCFMIYPQGEYDNFKVMQWTGKDFGDVKK